MNHLILDKSGSLEKIKGQSFEKVVLDVGCGSKKKNVGAIGIDILDSDCVDIVGDVFDIFSEIPNACVDSIYCSHFIEHLDEVKLFLTECRRILRPGGAIVIVVPHFSNSFFYSDPTHHSFYGLYSMSYYSEDKIFRRQVPTYSRIENLFLDSVYLNFRSIRPRYLRHLMFKFFGYIFNASPWLQEVYEECFSKFIGCYEIKFTLKNKV